jgi:hypothetical protein
MFRECSRLTSGSTFRADERDGEVALALECPETRCRHFHERHTALTSPSVGIVSKFVHHQPCFASACKKRQEDITLSKSTILRFGKM